MNALIALTWQLYLLLKKGYSYYIDFWGVIVVLDDAMCFVAQLCWEKMWAQKHLK